MKNTLTTALALSLGITALTTEAGTPGITGVYTSKYVFAMTSFGAPVGEPTPPQDWVLNFDTGTIDITNEEDFFNAGVWTAHSVTFSDNGDGTYSGTPGAANMLFDWSVNFDIPVEITWDITLLPNDTLLVTTVDTVILPSSPVFPGFNPAFFSPSIICSEFNTLTDIEVSVDIDISADLINTCQFVDGTAVLDGFTDPTNGVLTENAGTLTYLPNEGFAGIDEFTYTAKDDSVTAAPVPVKIQVGGELQGNFTMLDGGGNTFGGTNDIEFTFGPGVDPDDPGTFNTDESDTNFGKLEIESTTPFAFNGFLWDAHDIRIYGPGTYSFDTGCTVAQLKNMGCPAGSVGGKTISMIVGPGQIGAHILFDWSTTINIDVVNVWDKNAAWDRFGKTGEANKLYNGLAGLPAHQDAIFELVSTDVAGFTTPEGMLMPTGDGFNGAPMVDGPFEKFYANFSYKPDRGAKVEVLEIRQGDTELGGSSLASLDLYALFIGMVSLLGLRRFIIK